MVYVQNQRSRSVQVKGQDDVVQNHKVENISAEDSLRYRKAHESVVNGSKCENVYPQIFFWGFAEYRSEQYPACKGCYGKKTQVSTRTCIVENAMLESNSLEVIDERIMQGVVTSRSRSTKYLVDEAGNIPFLYRKKPTAMIKNIEITLDIIVNMRLF